MNTMSLIAIGDFNKAKGGPRCIWTGESRISPAVSRVSPPPQPKLGIFGDDVD